MLPLGPMSSEAPLISQSFLIFYELDNFSLFKKIEASLTCDIILVSGTQYDSIYVYVAQ